MSKKKLTLEDIEQALDDIIIKQGITIGPPELVEVAAVLGTGEPLYKANLGTKEHPFWIFGNKESVQKRIGLFQRQVLDILKSNKSNGNNTSSIHN